MFLNDRITATEDRNLFLDRITIESPPGVADPVPISAEAMTEEYERREQAVLLKSKADIEKYRKTKAVVKLTDSARQTARRGENRR